MTRLEAHILKEYASPALGSFRTRQQEGGSLWLGSQGYSSWSSRCWVIFPPGQESPLDFPLSHPPTHSPNPRGCTAGAQRALPLDRKKAKDTWEEATVGQRLGDAERV